MFTSELSSGSSPGEDAMAAAKSRLNLTVSTFVLLVGLACALADAQTSKRRVDKNKDTAKRETRQPAHSQEGKARSPTRKARAPRSYQPTRREYSRVRVTRYPRRHDGRLDVRPVMLRSARVRPVVLDRFEDRRREHVDLVIRHLRAGDRVRALETWRLFIDGLVEFNQPVDLDEVMLYVSRESCLREDESLHFYAARLEFLLESYEHLDDYIDQLAAQHDACTRSPRPCSSDMLRQLQREFTRARADREIVAIERRVAEEDYEASLRGSADYERRFGATFEDLYREVEVRVIVSP